jgi:glycerol-3-phosphate dehydrogenase
VVLLRTTCGRQLFCTVSQPTPSAHFDLAVVGAAVLGLASALAATRRGLGVVVIDREAQANSASVRNLIS